MKSFVEVVEDMLAYKESLGYSRRTYASFLLNDLAIYVEKNLQFGGFLYIKDIEPWCQKRDTEQATGYRRRLTTARELTKYLYSTNQCDAVISMDLAPIIHKGYMPYMFSDNELVTFFDACDRQRQKAPLNPLYSDIVRVIYRLIYFCGLRPNEGRELSRNDVSLAEGTLFIRKNKSHKERLIPMAQDVAEMCDEYAYIRDVVFPDSEYFFPSPAGTCYSKNWLCNNFLGIWRSTFPQKNGKEPRVYDLRHRFATTVMADHMDQGEDLYSFLPYLSAYMGHESFQDTLYYVHLLPDRLRNSPALDYERFSEVFPEVPSDD